MKDVFPCLMIYAGSVLMAYNIYGYICFSRDVRKHGNWDQELRLLYFPIWLLILFFPGMFISIFSHDSVLRADAIHALRLYFIAFIFQSLQYGGQTMFKSLNKKKQAIFFSLFRKVVMVVPLTYLLPHLWSLGTDGVFLAEPVSNVIGGLACFITMYRTVFPELREMQ